MRNRLICAVLAVIMTIGLSSCGSDGVTSLTALEAQSEADSSSQLTRQAEVSEYPTTTPTLPYTSTTTAKKTTKATTTKAEVIPVEAEVQYYSGTRARISHISKVSSNEELKKYLDKFDAIAAEYGSDLGLAYYCPDTDVTVTYNADKVFQTCSTVKVPYVKSLLESGTDLDELVTINKVYMDAAPEEEHLTAADKGRQYTVRKLIENSVKYSDNTAYVNLIERFGRYVFNAGQYSKGINYQIYDGYYFAMASANQMLGSFKDVYDYSRSDERGKWLVQLMTDTSFDVQIGPALEKKYTVAHKYGSDMETKSYHDCAICYAERPFILIIFTEQVPETEKANKDFQELAVIFDKLNETILE